MQRITRSEKETAALAKEFSKLVKPGSLILLVGDLGAGKTTFVKYLVKALKIRAEVLSPTFVLERIYANKKLEVHHYDLYRLEDENALEDLNILENLDGGCICIIEWPDVAKKILPKEKIIVKIEKISDNERKFKVEVEK